MRSKDTNHPDKLFCLKCSYFTEKKNLSFCNLQFFSELISTQTPQRVFTQSYRQQFVAPIVSVKNCECFVRLSLWLETETFMGWLFIECLDLKNVIIPNEAVSPTLLILYLHLKNDFVHKEAVLVTHLDHYCAQLDYITNCRREYEAKNKVSVCIFTLLFFPQIAAENAGSIGILPCCVLGNFFT